MSSMVSIPNGRYSVEMRSGKVIKIDEGFTNLLGYTEDDVKEGLVFKQFVPDVEYDEIISDLRATFINERYACYQHEMLAKDGSKIKVVGFINIQNKLLEGHRVLEIGVANISSLV